jgi:hypothetical protein
MRDSFIFKTNLDEFWSVHHATSVTSAALKNCRWQLHGILEHSKVFFNLSSSKIWSLQTICFEKISALQKNRTISAETTKLLGYYYYLFSKVF